MAKPNTSETLSKALQVLMDRPDDRPRPRPISGRPTSAQASLKSRRKAQESGWVRMEVLLSPVQSRKLDLLAEIHGSRRKALAYLIDQS